MASTAGIGNGQDSRSFGQLSNEELGLVQWSGHALTAIGATAIFVGAGAGAYYSAKGCLSSNAVKTMIKIASTYTVPLVSTLSGQAASCYGSKSIPIKISGVVPGIAATCCLFAPYILPVGVGMIGFLASAAPGATMTFGGYVLASLAEAEAYARATNKQ